MTGSTARLWRLWWNGQARTGHYAPPQITPVPEQRTAMPGAPAGLAEASPHITSPAPADEPHRPATLDAPPALSDIVEQLRLEEPRHPLDEQVEVAGETYHVKGIRRAFRDHGMPITSKGTTLDDVVCILVPERWNEHDPNAVAVLVGAHHVGYLPADLALHYSPGLLRLAELGTLASGLARIWAKADSGVIRARVTVLLPEATAFA